MTVQPNGVRLTKAGRLASQMFFLILSGWLVCIVMVATTNSRVTVVEGHTLSAVKGRYDCSECIANQSQCQDECTYLVMVDYQFTYNRYRFIDTSINTFGRDANLAEEYYLSVSVPETSVKVYVDTADPTNSDLRRYNLVEGWQIGIYAYLLTLLFFLIALLCGIQQNGSNLYFDFAENNNAPNNQINQIII